MIRKLERKDKENWIKLYCGYAKFYKVLMNNEILNTSKLSFKYSSPNISRFILFPISHEPTNKTIGIMINSKNKA